MRRSTRKEIRSFTVPGYGRVTIYYSSYEKQFEAKVLDELLVAKSENELEQAVHDLLAERHSLAWQPAIRMSDDWPDSQSYRSQDRIELSFDRLYVAVTPQGDVVQMSWHDDQDDQPTTNYTQRGVAWRGQSLYWYEKWGKFVLPCHSREDYYVPYSVPVWRGLCATQETLRAVRQQLHKLVSTTEGHKRLASAKFNLLEAPKK